MSTALQSEDLAFESLYRLHRLPVYAYALSTLRHAADAEDVTQTTFLNAYCALHRGVAPRDDLQWLLAIARNVCRDRFRDAKRRPKEEPLADWMRLVQPEEPDYSVREICKEISGLSPRYRQILLMREFEGRSYAEISTHLGVTEPAVQTLLARARRALRDELELGMTCAHARRVSLRHLNGVALRDERRALQRHLRKCAECATFVGRTPRTPVGHMLWICSMPYRRLIAIFAGTSAPAGTSAGASGALAVKLLAITAIGSTAIGVTAKEVADGPVRGHGKPALARPAPVAASHHSGGVRSGAIATSWSGTPRIVAGRAPLTHTSHHPVPWLPQVSGTSPSGTAGVQARAAVETPPAQSESTPATAVSTVQPDSAGPTAAPQDSASAVVGNADSAAAASPSVDGTADPAVDTSATPPSDSSAPTTPAGTTAPVAPDPTTPLTPATTPPVSTPTPPAQGPGHSNGPGNGNGNGNAVGQGGTPPGQANKPDPPAHGRS